MRIGVLSNLSAGRGERQVTRLLHFLRQHPEVITVETDSAGVVPEALAEMSRKEVDLLCVNGGDGTLQHALTEILGNRAFEDRVPLIAPLRGGRTNMSALDLGTQRDPVKGLAQLIEASRDGSLIERVSPRQILRVDYGSFDSREFLYGMFFGAGVIYRAIELVHGLFPAGRSQGVLGATLVTAALIGRTAAGRGDGILAPDRAEILLDGEPIANDEFFLLISSTLGRLFSRMRPFWGRGSAPLRVTALAGGAKRKAGAIPGILRGRPGSWVTPDNGYTSANVKRAELEMDCGFTVDGELVAPAASRNVTLSADQRVRFVRA